jgi:hypothetical protein
VDTSALVAGFGGSRLAGAIATRQAELIALDACLAENAQPLPQRLGTRPRAMSGTIDRFCFFVGSLTYSHAPPPPTPTRLATVQSSGSNPGCRTRDAQLSGRPDSRSALLVVYATHLLRVDTMTPGAIT